MNNTKLYYWPKSIIALLTFGVIGFLTPMFAQDDADDSDIFDLNPFTINEDENVGYLARSSLAGTRLNTPLRDIAATVSVVTEEFLKDTGTSDLQELLVYTAGTEISGIAVSYTHLTLPTKA